MNQKTLNRIKNRLTYPAQNWEGFVELCNNKQKISFFSWECPPRQIATDPILGRWINFDIDIQTVVNGKKLDKFTELPRLTTQIENEKWFQNSIVASNSQFTYTKIVADTNGLYLFPKSSQILGKTKIKRLSEEFARLLMGRAVKIYGPTTPKVILFTSLMAPYKKEYQLFFDLIYTNIKLVPRNIYLYWMNRLINHVGLDSKADKVERVEILKRVIASYAAEGMIFSALQQTSIFPNPVWVNWEEKPQSAQTTEILRSRYGISLLPVLYFLSEG